jgi:predicted deacylase/glutamine amidotransferase-like uncharacterized protein
VNLPVTTALTILFIAIAPAPAQGPGSATAKPSLRITHHSLAKGSRFATKYTVIETKVKGPTVMVIGGVHGNEPSGAFAARQIAGWAIEKGRLVVVERTNELALQADVRRIPNLPEKESDLNRQFPRKEGGKPVGTLATALWKLTKKIAPDYFLDLHEGYDFTQINPKSVGSSIILGSRQLGREAALSMLDAVNATIENPQKKFVLKGPAVAGSIARAVADRLGTPSMILETTTKDQARAYRVRQHRLTVHRFLTDLGMLTHSPHRMIGTSSQDKAIKVGMYAAGGVSKKGPPLLESLLTRKHNFVVRRVCAADVRDGSLSQFDVAIFPGGSMRGQATALQNSGRDAIRGFVKEGGGYVGICAGAYLASNNYDVSLRILDADVIDRSHWARGRGPVPVEFTTEARARFGMSKSRHSILYVNGPIYAPSGDPELPDFQVLARYRGEVTKEGVPGGVMPGTPAIVVSDFGKGRVVCSSPHPEQTEGLEEMLRRLVRAAVEH